MHTLVCLCVQLLHDAGMLGGQSLGSTHLHSPGGNPGRPAASEGSAGQDLFSILLQACDSFLVQLNVSEYVEKLCRLSVFESIYFKEFRVRGLGGLSGS